MTRRYCSSCFLLLIWGMSFGIFGILEQKSIFCAETSAKCEWIANQSELDFFQNEVRHVDKLTEYRGHVVVVSNRMFLNSLQKWIDYRTKQGYSIHVLTWSNADCSISAEQIKEQLQLFVSKNDLVAVLLVGAGISRTENDAALTIPAPKLPTRLIQHFGNSDELVSDNWYVDFHGDGIPKCPIGRFPVATNDELEAVIQKTIVYETIPAGLWNRRIQLVAGLANFSPILDTVIDSSVRHVISEMIPVSWQLSFLHADWRSPYSPFPLDYPEELVASLDSGSLFWAYLGHGQCNQLDHYYTPRGFVATMNTEQMPLFKCRDTLPIALLFCCYTGALDAESPCLAERMFLQTSGPVAVVAASRTTMPFGMTVFGIEWMKTYLKQNHDAIPTQSENMRHKSKTIGHLFHTAKLKMISEFCTYDNIKKSHEETKKGNVLQQKNSASEPSPHSSDSLRNNLTLMAKMFDPMPELLEDQLREHVELFHLFGDPLLVVPFPKNIPLVVQKRGDKEKTLLISGQLLSEQPVHVQHETEQIMPLSHNADIPNKLTRSVLVEILPSPAQMSLRLNSRTKFEVESDVRQQYNDEYRRAKEPVVFRQLIPAHENRFSIDIPIPRSWRGTHVVRIFATSETECEIGGASF
ncbi:MAG: C25 family cysteine peptidase [Thermoguttaceae bacterium]